MAVVYLGDRFLPAELAQVPVTDPGYLLGDGVFATLRGYDGACFRPERHLAALVRGAEALGLPLPMPAAVMAEIADEAARRTGEAIAYVRVTLARGSQDRPSVLSLLARAYDVPTDDQYERGIPTTVVGPRRIPPECFAPGFKSTSYAAQLVARREANARGASEGIQLAIDGALACGTMSNLFVVRGRELVTPPLATGCREGITRGAVLELAEQAGLVAREGRLEPNDLFEADEAFFTSTRVECLGIASVDGRPIGNLANARSTRALRKALRELALRETSSRRASP
ncbi:Branched-chain amino acid aminotransferase [Labilithrix luteola]|uniref:branched-chain-amino-acid transaminase n=1 Tax=Labilithrix luteola TaxID=1391654 RepID=A0A0K1QCE0_9BACT|nr:aminotransferase class IV [Labilithrix luteola]AKV03414.1 Branched-chain amino acid aminotransferase [Labilithrix luteola]